MAVGGYPVLGGGCAMLRKIKLYGKLAKFIGKRVLQADVATAAEAVRFLVANWPELERHMQDQHYRVSVGNYDLDADELHDPAGEQIIKIVPVITGSGAVGRIIAGVALVALSFAFPGAGAFGAGFGVFGPLAPGAIATLTTVGNVISLIGASLVLGGVAQLISPTSTTALGQNQQDDPRKSYSFSGVQNVSRAGIPVPIIFGEVLVGSIVVSAAIDIDQI